MVDAHLHPFSDGTAQVVQAPVAGHCFLSQIAFSFGYSGAVTSIVLSPVQVPNVRTPDHAVAQRKHRTVHNFSAFPRNTELFVRQLLAE